MLPSSVQRWEQAQLLPHEILQALPNPVLVISRDGEVCFANAAATLELGERLVGRSLVAIFPNLPQSATAAGLRAPVRLCSSGGIDYDARPSPLGPGATCLSLWPVAEGADADQPAALDELTGLARRNPLMAALSACLATPAMPGEPAVLCIDLDRFKMINDTLGHAVGDALLKKVADRLRGACRSTDLVARLGGDEFAVLLPDSSGPEDAQRLAARLVDLIGRTYVLHGHTINIGASIGVAHVSPGVQARDLLRNADVALYEAKRAGRSRYAVFQDSMAAALQARRELEIELRRALALRQLRLDYQPFVDVLTGEVTGFEALVRWHHPVRGRVAPIDFVPLAEENGLIVRIGEWVIRTACAAAAEWPGKLVVAVNVSPVQFRDNNLLQVVSSALAHSGLEPARLELEITEGALLDDTENVLATLNALRELGVKISMDDFGTGYSSLSYLQKFPFSKIKIDRSFVVNSGADSDAIVQAVAGLGNSLGVQITAEGVETADQLERVRSQACTHVQGYLTGRPIAQDKIADFLSEGLRIPQT